MPMCSSCGAEYPYKTSMDLTVSFGNECEKCEKESRLAYKKRLIENPVDIRECEICTSDYEYDLRKDKYDYRIFSCPGNSSGSLYYMCKKCLAKYDDMIDGFLGVIEGIE